MTSSTKNTRSLTRERRKNSGAGHEIRRITNVSAHTVIFDADDTLWETQSLYSDSKNRFFLEMLRVGFPIGEVRDRFEKIDNENVSKFGFSKSRFPRSMRDTYSVFCAEYARPF